MAFEAKDLMWDVFAQGDPLRMKCQDTTPPPVPPCKPPSAKAFTEDGVELPPLAALREQLQHELPS
jgi:hypothetical protein